MSREKKLRKQKSRRERGKSYRLPALTRRMELPPGTTLLSYDITFDAMRSLTPEQHLMDAIDDDRVEFLHGLVFSDPAKAVEEIRLELDQHPGVPTLLQWLATALCKLGQNEAAERIIEKNYLDFPDYLFARLNYFSVLLSDGKLEEVERLLNRQYDLKLMYPQRTLFHVTEVTAFEKLMVQFFIRKGEIEIAGSHMNILEELTPNDPDVEALQEFLSDNAILKALRNFKKFAGVGRASKAVNATLTSLPPGGMQSDKKRESL